MLRWALVIAFACLALASPGAAPAEAERAPTAAAPLPPEIIALSRVLKMAEVMAILRDEGIAGGAELAADLPQGAEDPLWTQALDRIYDPARMEAVFNAALAGALADQPETVAAAAEFFGSDLGQRVLTLELSARRALLDDEVEAAARQAYAGLAPKDAVRQALIDRFVAANDLIESNVMGTLNAILAFRRGLAEAGGAAFAMPDSDLLAQVWSAEAGTRAEVTRWLFPFLMLAYQPLSDAELETYVAFSESPAGRRTNRAMFAAFDAVFAAVSRDLGRAFARAMQGEDI